jgi:hypothetical protein
VTPIDESKAAHYEGGEKEDTVPQTGTQQNFHDASHISVEGD